MTKALVFLICAALAEPVFSQPRLFREQRNPSSPAPAPAKAWEFSAAAFTYIVPDETNYASPNFRVDRTWLHMEARYNYEDRQTASVWMGYNFKAGNNLVFEITPMVGAVFGRTKGVAPGALMSITYKKFDISTENEYVVNTDDRTANFFYTWSELGYSPLNWLRVGLVAQRNRAYQTPLDVQRGVFVGASHKNLDFTTYLFNLGWTDPTVVLAMAFKF